LRRDDAVELSSEWARTSIPRTLARMQIPAAINDWLARFGQEHLIRWWGDLSDAERQSLLEQIEVLDLPLIARLISHCAERQPSMESTVGDRAAQAGPPADVVRQVARGGCPSEWEEADALGRELLGDGRIGAILVAGGQGTRLGFVQPKGMFRIGPVSRKSLFQLHCEQVLARSRRAGAPIPYFIMTSDATHADTVAFFEQHRFFGLPRDDVYFFRQGSLPAVAPNGRILMAGKDRISMSPDGHGGILRALARAGLLDVMRERGIDHLYYHQVDNPAANVCEPAFLGWHAARGSELSTKVIAKESPDERMGVVVTIEGRTEIIEYSDLPAELAVSTAPDGSLQLWAGNTAMHVFSRAFLERLTSGGRSLPFHTAHKTVPHLDDQGNLVVPDTPNAFKFEQFIFDALPFAERALVVEAERSREFHPVKNHSGRDSPETSRAGLLSLHRQWLHAAGAHVDEGVQVEISPLLALDEDELRAAIPPGMRFAADAVVE
jgi:UDP-N-acetylglucosamine/UDP-N-acetylgalactosamine diphosphorylase